MIETQGQQTLEKAAGVVRGCLCIDTKRPAYGCSNKRLHGPSDHKYTLLYALDTPRLHKGGAAASSYTDVRTNPAVSEKRNKKREELGEMVSDVHATAIHHRSKR
jgi:hypothetical protein